LPNAEELGKLIIKIMFSPVEEIKSRLDLAEFIQSYVRLQKAGINYKTNCPFHAEKTPSFFVSPSRQIWHCFGGCGEGGDIFKFVMKIEGMDFPEALKLLAERAGVVLKREDPAIRSERNLLYDLCEEAAKIFEKSLSLTPAACAYLKKRGVKEDTIINFRIGFAPQSWDFLLKSLVQKGFKREEIEKAGLAIKSQDNSSWYDRFRSRIIFPILDVNGRVIGFGGRIFVLSPEALDGERMKSSSAKVAEEAAKYINTPQTVIYDKSRVLYGFDKAKQEIRAKNQAVIVEGYMDCVMSHQAGVKNTIAVSGTALTQQQLGILKRLTDTIVTSFDTDAAGDFATKRSLALAAQFEFKRKIAKIPSGKGDSRISANKNFGSPEGEPAEISLPPKDPADAVLENPQFWREAVEQAKEIVSFYFDKLFHEYDPSSVEGKKIITERLLPLVAELTDEIEKAHWAGLIAARLGVEEQAVWKELARKNYNSAVKETVYDSELRPILTRRELLEERMLALLTLVKEEVKARELKEHHLIFGSHLNKELFRVLSAGSSFAAADAEPNLREQLASFGFKGEILSQITKDIDKEFIICKQELERQCIRDRLSELGTEIRKKESEGDSVILSGLLQDFRQLSEKLKILS